MSLDLRYTVATSTYRGAVLDVILQMVDKSAFAATTLACCAIDLLSHVLYEPSTEQYQSSYIKTVEKWITGYHTEDIAPLVYELRCGLVHEFRTRLPGDGGNALLSDGFDAAPFFYRGDVIISAQHFCRAVCNAFESFFTKAETQQRSAFISKTYLFISEARTPAPQLPKDASQMKNVSVGNATLTTTVPVSGSQVRGFYLGSNDDDLERSLLDEARRHGIW